MTKQKKSLVARIYNVTVSTVAVILALLIALALISKATGKKFFSYTLMWVLSPSMEDTIPAKSYILVKSVNPEEVKVGDVITFTSTDPTIYGELNTHRVVEISEDGQTFTTKGDHNALADQATVSPDRIVARYVCNLPILTFLGRLFATKMGFAAVIILILVDLYFRLAAIRKRADAVDKEKEMQARIEEEIAKLEAEHKAGKSGDASERNDK